MKNLVAAVAFLTFGSVDAFVSSGRTALTPRRRYSLLTPRHVATTPPAPILAAQDAHDDDCPYKDTYELNKALRKLASLKGDADDHVDDDETESHGKRFDHADTSASMIAKAASCQEEWEKYRFRQNGSVQADLFSLNTVLKAWSRCAQFLAEQRSHSGSSGSQQQPVSMDRTVNNAVSAQAVTANGLSSSSKSLSIYSIYTAQEAAQRATDLLVQQENEAKADKTASIAAPNAASYNICMDCWSKCRRPESPDQVEELFERMQRNKALQPTVMTYNALIEAHAHSDRLDRMERILELWKEIDDATDIQPSVWTFNALLYAYSRAGKMQYDKLKQQQQSSSESVIEMSPHYAAKECLLLLKRMKTSFAETNSTDDRPDIMTYSIIIEALGRCGSPDMTRKAEELLEEVKRIPYLQPTSYTYAGVLSAWARTRLPEAQERADALLQEVLDKKLANTKTFTTTIQAWSRSDSPKKAARCLELLKQMKEMKASGVRVVSPDSFAYQIVIDACASVKGNAIQQNAALRIAFAVFKSMQLDTSVHIGHSIFSSLLNAAARLLPPGEERSQVASAVFEKAIAAQKVDNRVIWSMRQGADASTVQKLLALTGSQPDTSVVKKPSSTTWQSRTK
ncbi:hypothetical protein MPSEU_000404400 [Mayamaea pseudoterrestris]|nr:hypothetical protein MPSEU_000404400 [Mayamaea pseudoterrestris]